MERGEAVSITIRPAADGSFDEIVARNAYVHIEVMARLDDTNGDYSSLWLVIEADGKRVTLNVSSKAELAYSCETEEDP